MIAEPPSDLYRARRNSRVLLSMESNSRRSNGTNMSDSEELCGHGSRPDG
jgi:hypothetical protein